MDNTNTADPQETPASTSPRGDSERARLEAQEAQLAAIAAELAELKSKLQTTEVALVTRVADVDDDRRDSTTRIQRAVQSLREDLAARFRRQRSIMLLLSVFVLLLIGCLAIVGYLGFDSMRRSILEEIAPVKAAIEKLRLNEGATQSQAAREKLSQLSAAVKSISTTVERLGSEQEDHQTRLAQTASSQPPRPGNTPAPTVPPSTSPAPHETPAEPAVTPEVREVAAAPATPAVEAPPPTPPPPPPIQEPPKDAASPAAMPAPTTPVTPIKVGDKPYSIQLMGFYTLDELQRYAHRYELPAQIYYREETYQGRPWFVLIHSLHPSRESANAAVTGLPSALSGLEIWIRKLDPDAEVTPLEMQSAN